MRYIVFTCVLALTLSTVAEEKKAPAPDKDGFYALFDGKSLDGWKFNEKPGTFSVVDGSIQVFGNRSHLFYTGPVNGAKFKNFHLKVEAKTFEKANSGIYFHTEYQEGGWPAKGFEVQVNQTHSDVKKTGGLYAIKDVLNQSPVKDDEWYTYDIIVKDKSVTVQINGKTVTEWTQPADWAPPKGMEGRKIGEGTIALQGHDPKSKVLFKSVMIKPLD